MIWVILCAVLYSVAHGVRLLLSWRYLRSRSKPDPHPAVILQPILSGDPDLPATLAANLRNAPETRFVWLIDTDDTEAQRIAAEVATPKVTITLVDPPQDGENPKLKKLIRGSEGNEGTLLVLDDDTMLGPGGAARLAGAANMENTLATAIPIWRRPPKTGAEALVAGFINGQGVSSYFSMSALGRNNTINGMAYAVPAGVLADLGGFAAAGHEVTDDWAVARLMKGHGYDLIQTIEPAEVAVSIDGFGAGLVLLRRWMLFAHRYMRANVDLPMLALVVVPGLLPLIGLIACLLVWPPLCLAWFGLLLVRAALHIRLVRAVAGPDVDPVLIGTVMGELVLPLISAAALWRPNRLRWRSRDMQLDANGSIRFR